MPPRGNTPRRLMTTRRHPLTRRTPVTPPTPALPRTPLIPLTRLTRVTQRIPLNPLTRLHRPNRTNPHTPRTPRIPSPQRVEVARWLAEVRRGPTAGFRVSVHDAQTGGLPSPRFAWDQRVQGAMPLGRTSTSYPGPGGCEDAASSLTPPDPDRGSAGRGGLLDCGARLPLPADLDVPGGRGGPAA
jgi:hypothetical protein